VWVSSCKSKRLRETGIQPYRVCTNLPVSTYPFRCSSVRSNDPFLFLSAKRNCKNAERQVTTDGCQAWNDASECKTRLQNSAKTFFKAQVEDGAANVPFGAPRVTPYSRAGHGDDLHHARRPPAAQQTRIGPATYTVAGPARGASGACPVYARPPALPPTRATRQYEFYDSRTATAPPADERRVTGDTGGVTATVCP